MEQNKLDRINELAKKSKVEPLSEAELVEQAALRAEYIKEFRASLRGTLNNTTLVNPDGSREKLSDRAKKED